MITRSSSTGDNAQKGHDTTALLDAHFRPAPRVDMVESLVAAGVQCAMDISDGLLIDLERICIASGVDAVVQADKVPVAEALSGTLTAQALELALTGGEDYELLFMADAEVVDTIRSSEDGSKPTVVGEIKPARSSVGKVTVLDETGDVVQFEGKGWDHFAR